MPAIAPIPDGPTVLIVDDDTAVRMSLGFLLETASLRVRLLASARELLDIVQLPERACILIDCDMPRMSGLELLRQLRGRAVRLPCILITGKHSDGIRQAAQAVGVVAVLEKPFESEDLFLAIHEALEQPHEHGPGT